jgi:hypothetical protein
MHLRHGQHGQHRDTDERGRRFRAPGRPGEGRTDAPLPTGSDHRGHGAARPGADPGLRERVTAVDVVGVAALLHGQKILEARPGGEMVLRINAEVRRALRDSGTAMVFQVADGDE